jgi:two-component system sensor histidine kinase KdpD
MTVLASTLATPAGRAGAVLVVFAATTAVAGVLDAVLDVQTAIVYLLAVVGAAFVAGTRAAVLVSFAAFLAFDYLFVEPRFTLTVRDPEEWTSLLIFLFVALVVGRLTASLVQRAEEAMRRATETEMMFRISRLLATSRSVIDAAPELLERLIIPAGVERLWLGLGPVADHETVVADTAASSPRMIPPSHVVLRRTPGDRPAEWVRIHQPRPGRVKAGEHAMVLRVIVEADGEPFGSLWAVRRRARGLPDLASTRLLAAAADQLGGSLLRERLEREATEAEIARQSDELKSALLQSVSHDLRTPLATIRAAAGTLRPDSPLDAEDRRESADAIDREVAYLDRLVTNLLDLSRIEAGVLRADRAMFELDDLVDTTIARLRPRFADRRLEVAVGPDVVEVDPVFLDGAISNLLENALKYVPREALVRVASQRLPGDRFVRLVVEDSGAGVPDAALPRLWEKFYRVPGSPGGSRSGTGIGMAVVRGLVEAFGGRVTARRSALGGLAIDLDLPAGGAHDDPEHAAR